MIKDSYNFLRKGCPAGLLRKSRAALGSERVRAALGSDGVRGGRRGGPRLLRARQLVGLYPGPWLSNSIALVHAHDTHHTVLSQTSAQATHVETPNEPLSALRIHGITRISSEHSQSHTHTGSHILSRGDSRHTGEGEGERAGAGAGAAAAAAEQRPLAAVAAPSVPERRLRGVRVRRGGKRGGAGTRGCGGEQAKDPCAVRRPARGRRVAGQGSSPHPTRRFERVEGTPAQGPQGDQW